MAKAEAVPGVVATETTDPNPMEPNTAVAGPVAPDDSHIETWSKRVSWVWMLAGVAVTLFGIGGASYRLASKLATKADLDAAMHAHATGPSDPVVMRRIDEIDLWRAAHDARHDADMRGLRDALDKVSHSQEQMLNVLIERNRRR